MNNRQTLPDFVELRLSQGPALWGVTGPVVTKQSLLPLSPCGQELTFTSHAHLANI